MFTFEIRESLLLNTVAYQADVHFWFLRLQLLSDLHSTLDGKPAHKLLLPHLITIPILQNIFLNFPARSTFLIRDSLGFYYLLILFSFVFYCGQLMFCYLQWMGVTITQS